MDRRRPRPRPALSVGLLCACTALPSCGSDTPVGPPPEPAPPAAAAAFVHVLAPPRAGEDALLSTHEVLAPTGELRLAASLVVAGARHLAADPRGRFLFVLGRRPRPGFLQSYVIDRTSGSLRLASDITLSYPHFSTPQVIEPVALAASDADVWLSRREMGTSAYRVEPATGTLYDGLSPWFPDVSDEPRWFLIPSSSSFTYVDAGDYQAGRGISVLSVRENGRYVSVASARTPGGAAQEAALAGECLVASWRTATTTGVPPSGGIASFRVAPSSGLLTSADSVAGFRPLHLAAGSGGWVAVTTGTELRTYSLNAACELRTPHVVPTNVSGTGGSEGWLAFHPSSPFVYVDQDGGLQVHAILDDGTVRAVAGVAGLRGRIVVTPVPSS